MKNYFRAAILHWNSTQNDRTMPWKNEKDPYKIWLSEIILQQTRVIQGIAYYEKFIKYFPNIKDLANAPLTKLIKLWEGLGYYSRCRNLHFTAQFIAKNYGGFFPKTYEEILALKGVGNYTAAAIASFAYNLPYAVLDGNVYRILSRYFGIFTPIDTTAAKVEFTQLAQELLDKKNAGAYNQAIMDFGATICKPKLPNCSSCTLQKNCIAFKNNWITTLPIKEKKLTIKKRYFQYLVLHTTTHIFIHKRVAKDVWQDFYEFTLIECTEKEFTNKSYLQKQIANLGLDFAAPQKLSTKTYLQKLTHQHITASFHNIALSKQLPIQNGKWVKKSEIVKYPFSALINANYDFNKIFHLM